MPAYKDSKQGTWYASFYFENWQGVKQKKLKRGFATKKDALAWERELLLQQAADLTMTFEAFVEIYITDKKKRLRENTWSTKEHIIRTKILPYFKEKRLSEIKPRDVIAWQNEMLNYRDKNGKAYSPTYEHLWTGKQEKLFHELIVQIGNKDDMGVLTENGVLAKELLDEYMQGFQERNPTLRVFGAFLHMDEATPHLHIDFVPYVSGWKGKGLDTKVSLKQALKALGFAGGSKRESELNQWINAEKEQLAAVMERHGIEWEQKGTHEEHLSVLDFKKQERRKEVAALEAAKREYQTDLTEMQEQLETAQTAVEAAEQRVQKAELTYQKQSQKLNKLAPIMDGLESLSAQYSQRPEEWVPEAATFETAKSYREKKAMPLIQKLVKVLFALHRKYWEVKDERDKYLYFYQDEKKATHHLSQRLKEVEAENSQLYAMKRDFGRVWNYFGAEKMQQVIGLMREQEQTTDRCQKKSRQSSVEL